MPYLAITLAAEPFEEVRNRLLHESTRIVAEQLAKPASVVCVSCRSEAMLFGGEDGPAAFLELRSSGGLDANRNAVLTRKLCRLLAREVDVPPERVFVTFVDIPPADWGWNGKTLG